MIDWNPDAPDVVGMQYRPTLWGVDQVTSSATGRRARFRSPASPVELETVTVWAGITSPDNDAPLIVDVYPVGDDTLIPAVTTNLYPTDQVSAGYWTAIGGGSSASLWANLDHAPESDPDGAGMTVASRTVGVNISFTFDNAASFTATGTHRIAELALRVRHAGGAVGLEVVHSGTSYGILTVPAVPSGVARVYEVTLGELCPWTGEPWTEADVNEFASTASVRVQRRDRLTSLQSPVVRALQLQIREVDEERVATAFAAAGSTTAPLLEAAGMTAGWTPAASTEYDVIVRVPRHQVGHGPESPKHLIGWTSGADLVDGGELRHITIDSLGQPGAVSGPLGRHASITLDPATPGAAGGIGSPYAILSGSASVDQHIYAPVGGLFGAIDLVVSPPSPTSTEPLYVTLKDEAGTGTLAVTQAITRRDLTTTGTQLANGWWRYVLTIPPSSVPATTTVRVQAEGEGWGIAVLYGNDAAGPAALTAGGAGSFEEAHDGADALVSLAVAPDPLGEPSTEVLYRPLQTGHACDPACCAPGQWKAVIRDDPVIRVSWPASELEGDWLCTQVERRDPITNRWQRIADLTDPVTEFDDAEFRFTAPTWYRVRQTNGSGIPSAWSYTLASTVVTAPKPGLWFTSNTYPRRDFAYVDVYDGAPERGLTSQDVVELVPFYARDYHVAFAEPETRGVAFTRTLQAARARYAPGVTSDVFDKLRAMRADVVCVRDHEGNRWWANVAVTDATLTTRADIAYADVSVTETQGDPPVVSASNLVLGWPWEELAGEFTADPTTQSARVVSYPDDTLVERRALAVADTGDTDGHITGRWTGTGTGVALRVIDEANLIAVDREGVTVIVDSVETFTAHAGGPLVGDLDWLVRVYDTGFDAEVEVWFDGDLIGTYPLSAPALDSATRHGLLHLDRDEAATGAWDLWYWHTTTLGQRDLIDTYERSYPA
jgi:hypothetical protein